MPGLRKAFIRATLESMYFSGTHRVLRPLCGGVGAILTLHHVRPARPDPFQPNRLLEVTPEFLEDVILRLRQTDTDIVSLDEMHRRIVARVFARRFVCLTLDDGYRDNRDWAYPILRRHRAPFTIFVPSRFADQAGELWWLWLEAAIARSERIAFAHDGERYDYASATPEEKQAAFDAIYWRLRALGDEGELRRVIRDLAERQGIDIAAHCRDLCMTWDEIRALAADPLATIGAHTVNHVMLRKAPEAQVRDEMIRSADAIERALGARPAHFSYPVGDPTSAGPREFGLAAECGFATAVTTRPGVLFPEHRDHLTALPRISLNGEFQRLRYLDVLISGAPTALMSRFRRVDAA